MLRQKIVLEVLARLQPLLLLQMVAGLPRTAAMGVAQVQALARSLLLDGQQRLLTILAAAPRLHLPVERWRELAQPGQRTETPEQVAAQALIELCLGLLLQWLNSHLRRHRNQTGYRLPQLSSVYLPSPSPDGPPRTRACPYLLRA
ncbi:MAG: hypothetical protein N2508_11915 [Anaerolineae bacterium]|nr:hypothetical protein [Anaerolineae bacterium]